MEQREKEIEREVNLRNYIDVIIKRRLVIVLSVAAVTISSLIFVPPRALVYKASAFIIVEGSPRDVNLTESIKRFIKSHILAEEVIRYMKFERAEALKAGGELAEWSLLDVTPDTLLSSILVEEEEPDILKTSVLGESPKKAKNLADAVAKVVVAQSFKGIAGGTQASLRYVEMQMEVLKQKIEETKYTLTKYALKPKPEEVVLPEEEHELEKLQEDYINTKLNRQMAEARLKVLQEKLTGLKKKEQTRFLILPQSKNFLKLRDKLSDLEKRRSSLLVQFTEEHPSVIEVQMDIDRTKEAMEEEIRRPLEDLKAQIAEAKSKEDTLKRIIETRFPAMTEKNKEKLGAELQIPQLMRELKIHEKTYVMLLDKREKLRLDALLDATKVRILRLAIEPKRPEETKGPPAIFIAMTLGLILGLTAAFMQENMDTSLKTVEEVEYYLNQPIIGVIPMIRSGKKRRKDYG